MESLKKILILLVLFSFNVAQIQAQPTDKKVKELSSGSTVFSGQTEEERGKKTVLEQEYLAKARQNIELIRKGEAALNFVDAQGKPLKNLQIDINQVSQDFLFGNLMFELTGSSPKDSLKVAAFKEKFKALFNFAVFPFYWESYEKKAGNPNWQNNQAALDWCLANGITCKGHPLGWTGPAGTPKWLLQQSTDVATELYKARIYNNVIGYKGKIDMWDVVNEPVNTVPWEAAIADTANNNDFRYSVKGISVDKFVPWVEKSFKWANEANPDGNYILNEYFTLAIPAIRDSFYVLLKELQKRKTPIKGIGIQAHEPREMWFSPVEMYKTFDLYKEFNVPIHITELIPQSSGKDITGWRSGKWTEQAQAEFAEQFYTLAFGHPSVASINWWGLSDKNIWLKNGGLLDKDYNPKPVYNTLLKLIKQDWMTKNVALKTDKNGSATFKGFFGKYDIMVTKTDGSKQILTIHLGKKEANIWTFTL